MNQLKKISLVLKAQKFRYANKLIMEKLVDLPKTIKVDNTLLDDEAALFVHTDTHEKIEKNCKIVSDSFAKLTDGMKDLTEDEVMHKLSIGTVLISGGDLVLKSILASHAIFKDGFSATTTEYLKKFDFEEVLDGNINKNCLSLEESRGLLLEVVALMEFMEPRKEPAEGSSSEKPAEASNSEKKMGETSPNAKPAEGGSKTEENDAEKNESQPELADDEKNPKELSDAEPEPEPEESDSFDLEDIDAILAKMTKGFDTIIKWIVGKWK